MMNEVPDDKQNLTGLLATHETANNSSISSLGQAVFAQFTVGNIAELRE